MTAQQDITSLGTIMGIWAHPDDETYSMAGIMATAVKNGQNVICITATRGEAGVQDESRWPASDLASIRTKELSDAFTVLGITNHHWLDYPDGGCENIAVDEAVTKITALIEHYRPDSIFTFGPDGMTGHSDHQTVSAWTTKAHKKAKSTAAIYHAIQTTEQYESMIEADKHLNIFFNIKKPPTCDECDCVVCYKLPSEIYDLKIQALQAMPSQTESMVKLFGNVLPQFIGREAFTLARPKQ